MRRLDKKDKQICKNSGLDCQIGGYGFYCMIHIHLPSIYAVCVSLSGLLMQKQVCNLRCHPCVFFKTLLGFNQETLSNDFGDGSIDRCANAYTTRACI